MTPQETFVIRLRRHRERGRISLDDIAAATCVKRELFEAFERNDLSAWPRGVYARAWIRAYAAYVGLDPIDTVEEFCRLFPHGDRRMRATIRGIAGVVATEPQYTDEHPHPFDRRRRDPDAPPPQAPWYVVAAQTARVTWQRVATVVAGYARRSPRTSSGMSLASALRAGPLAGAARHDPGQPGYPAPYGTSGARLSMKWRWRSWTESFMRSR
jgi:hypothetical protein